MNANSTRVFRGMARVLGVLAMLLATARPGAAADAADVVLYVAPNGADTNAGSQQQPLATLTGARDRVRRAIAGGLTGDVRVVIGGGTYRITEPIVLGPQDSPPPPPPGSNGHEHTITYAAAPAQTPMISGGRVIRGWRDAGDGTWRTTVAQVKEHGWRFRDLFVAGQRRPRARHPNAGPLRVVAAGADKRTSFTFNAGDIPEHVRAANLELVFLHDWSTSRVGVKAIDRSTNTLTVTDPIGPGSPHYRIDNFEPHPRYWLENDAALLDAPGEWFVDTDTGVLRYRPMPGEKLANFEAVAPVSVGLLVVRGEPGKPVRNVHFHGLHFAHSAWPLPQGGYAAGQAGFHERRGGGAGRGELPAAVTFELAHGCRFQNGQVSQCGGSGIWFAGRCRDGAIVNSTVRDVAGNGVMIGEDASRSAAGQPWWRASSADDDATHDVAVSDNLIERCGQQFFGSVGVWVGLARRCRVEHNEIRHLPYTGVSVGWMWNPTPTPCGGNRIAFNHIHHVMQLLSDGGGIYTLGRQPGTVLAGNVIHDVPLNAGRAQSNGMFLDEGTTELVIEKNVIFNVVRSPLRFHQARENLVRGNVMVTGDGVPLVRYNATDAALIKLADNQVFDAATWSQKRAAGLPAPIQAMIAAAGPRTDTGANAGAASCAEPAAEAPAPRKIVIIAGKKSHGPEGNRIHDYPWSAKLIKVMLDNSNVADQVRVEFYRDGWPADEATLEDADTIMIISDGRDGDRFSPAPHQQSDARSDFVQKQMKRGCGIVTFHFSTFAPDKFGQRMLAWGGGYFDWEDNGKRQWYSAIRTLEADVKLPSPQHPIARGVRPFRMTEEFYYNIRFAPGDAGVVPLLEVPALAGRAQMGNVVAWARQRDKSAGGGRGFGTTCGHFYDNWKNDDFRKLVLNAVIWTAGANVPSTGVDAPFYTHEQIKKALQDVKGTQRAVVK